MKEKVVVFWFRRDLRLEDNVGLYQALISGFSVMPIFIFDKGILDRLADKEDRRVDYIHQSLSLLNSELRKYGSRLNTYYGEPTTIFESLCEDYDIQSVFCNRDYEPPAIARDTLIYQYFSHQQVPFRAFKDQVIFDKNDVVKKDGTPYTVYTPYCKQWKQQLLPQHYQRHQLDLTNLYQQDFKEILSLVEIGFKKTDLIYEVPELDEEIVAEYDKYRDFPALQRTTQLGVALRFGTISVRACVSFALMYNQVWLNELVWREFFMQILYHYPKVVDTSFKIKYDAISWRNDESEFDLWCKGLTGYPIVDAGMRQLNETGYMHNRVRMIVASFLCKHLLIDWRWGEAYFAEKLIDYDLSANNGNWQWVSGSGCDAAPYFRVFNPAIQTEKFDKDSSYIKRWLPEFGTNQYPTPIVEHTFARERALKIYGEALKDYN